MTLMLFTALLVQVAVAPDGTCATASAAGVQLADKPLGETRRVFSVAFSSDGKYLAEGGGSPAESGEVRVWDVASRKLLFAAKEHKDVVMAVAWSGDSLFAASADKTISRLDLTGKVVARLEGHAGPVLCLSVSPDGTLLVSGSVDRSLRVWDLATNKFVRTLSSHSERVNGCAWSPDGKFLASASKDQTVRIFQPQTGRMVRIIRGHDSEVTAVAWGDHLYSGTADGKVRVMGEEDQVLKTIDGTDPITSLATVKGGVLAADCKGNLKEAK
jgi:WD40 repeat protein